MLEFRAKPGLEKNPAGEGARAFLSAYDRLDKQKIDSHILLL